MVRTEWLTSLALASALLGAGAGPAVADAPSVVASIKPIHSLVAGVMQGVGDPILLVDGSGSPHGYSLRPSEAGALEDADLVFWVGEGMETFLGKPLSVLSSDAQVVELGSLDGLTLLPLREGGTWASEEHEHDAEHESHEHEGHGSVDMHVWLDPGNARIMTDAIADALGRADPGHAAAYARNAEALSADLARLDKRLAHTLAPVADRPYVVFHDAYHYLEHRYGLNGIGSITVSPERPPGAQRLQEIRDDLARREAACVFAEPQFEPALVQTVVEGTGARTGVLDPLGASLDEGPQQYFQLLGGLADALVGCLFAR
jgi:zinc transport system substrate-binding protein